MISVVSPCSEHKNFKSCSHHVKFAKDKHGQPQFITPEMSGFWLADFFKIRYHSLLSVPRE